MQKQCPYCGEIIDTNLTICPICCEKLPQVQEDKNANTKICPFCKEEIASDSTVCPICFEKLSQPLSQNNTQKKKSESKPKTLKKRKQPIKQNVSVEDNSKDKKIKKNHKKILVIIFSLILVLVFCAILGTIGYIILSKITKHTKTIDIPDANIEQETNIKTIDLNDPKYQTDECDEECTMENSQIIKYLQIDENKLNDYFMENHSPEESSKFFLEILKDISKLCQKNCSFYPYTDDNNEENKIIITRHNTKYKYFYIPNGYEKKPSMPIYNVKLLSPNLKIAEYRYAGEGYHHLEISFKYLRDSYSKYLTQDMQEYLSIKAMQEEDLNGFSLNRYEANTAENEILKKWINTWKIFVKKYPNFPLNNIILYHIDGYNRELKAESPGGVTYDDNVPELTEEENNYFSYL